MKNIIRNLEKELEKLRELIQAREDKVDDMSAKWQESEKCEEWEDKTQDIEQQANELDTIIDNLKEQS
jgi:L-rhamnose mutarotase